MISLKFNLIHGSTHIRIENVKTKPNRANNKGQILPPFYRIYTHTNPSMKSHFCFISRQFVSCCCHNAPVLLLMTRGAFCLFREEFPLMYCFENTEIKFVSKLSGEVFYDNTSARGGSRVRCHIKTEGICFCVYYVMLWLKIKPMQLRLFSEKVFK